jgi:hypothetical protein
MAEILPVSQMIQTPNLLAGYQQGLQFGQQQRDRRNSQQAAQLYAQAMQAPPDQRPALLAQIAQLTGVEGATNAQSGLGRMDTAAHDDLVQTAGQFAAIAEADPATAQQMYPTLAAKAHRIGIPVPTSYDPKFLPAIQKLAGAMGGAGAVQSTYVDAQGQRVAIMRDGSVRPLGMNAPNVQIIDNGDGFYGVNKGNLQAAPVVTGGPQASLGAGPATSAALDPTRDFPQLAQAYGAVPTSLYRDPQHNAQVGGVPNSQHMRGTAGDFVIRDPQQRQAFIAQARQMGYEPIDEGDHVHLELPRGAQASGQFGPGQQLRSMPKPADLRAEQALQLQMADRQAKQTHTLSPAEVAARGYRPGTIVQVDGYGNESVTQAPEGARNSMSDVDRRAILAAKQKVPQLQNAIRGLDRIDAALKKLDGTLADTGPIDQYVQRFTPAGQELDAAVGGIQNSILALTRVPGIGSQSDLEARIAMLQYPSLDKAPEVNRRTLENLRYFMQDLANAYQNVLSQPDTAPSVSHGGAAPAGGWSIQEVR